MCEFLFQNVKKESVWSEHTSPDGTKYYYNKVTKKSQWEKPDELKTQEEVLTLFLFSFSHSYLPLISLPFSFS
jgi:hypothetical protein